MSFSTRTKEEIVKIKVRNDRCALAQLAGIIHTCGALCVGRGGVGALFTTETQAVARHIALLIDLRYGAACSIEVASREGGRKPLTTVSVTGEAARRMLLETGLLAQDGDGLALPERAKSEFFAGEEVARSFFRGAFLGGGSCAHPYRGYHLEIVTRTEAFAAQLAAASADYDAPLKCMRRKEKYIVYAKGDDVSAFLTLVGATQAALACLNVRAERDYRNYINRASNCETANIGKTVNASAQQRMAIEFIEANMGLKRLPAALYEAALLRMNYPDATLQELADMAEIGKSGMNHRLERLMRIAEEIKHG